MQLALFVMYKYIYLGVLVSRAEGSTTLGTALQGYFDWMEQSEFS